MADAEIIDYFINWFGFDVRFETNHDEKTVRVTLTAGPMAMHHRAMQYAEYVEILSSKSLRDTILKTLQEAVEKYCLENLNKGKKINHDNSKYKY